MTINTLSGGKRRLAGLALVAALTFVMAACGSGGADSPAVPAEPAQPSVEPGVEEDAEVEPIHIVHAVSGDPGVEAIPGLYALDQLKEKYGHTFEVVQTAETAILMEGLSTGDFNFGGGASAAGLRAIGRGAEFHVIGVEAGMQWLMAAEPGTSTCADHVGKRIGIHAAGSAGEGYFNYWISQNCTAEEAAEIKILYVAGSGARTQALLVGQLDAGMVTVSDMPLLADRFSASINFADALAGRVLPNPLYVNEKFLADNPRVVEQFLEEVVAIQREMAGNEERIVELLLRYLPQLDEEGARAAARAATEARLFPEDGGYSALANIATIVEFLIEDTGELEASARDALDRYVRVEPLEAALNN